MICKPLPSFYRDIKKIKDKKLKKRIALVLKKIESSISIKEIQGAEKLSGFKNSYKIRIGSYRIGFDYTPNKKLIEFSEYLTERRFINTFPNNFRLFCKNHN